MFAFGGKADMTIRSAKVNFVIVSTARISSGAVVLVEEFMEGITVLAEIFMLRLERQLRSKRDAAQTETPRYVRYVPLRTLPNQKG